MGTSIKKPVLNNAVHAFLLKKLFPQGKFLAIFPKLEWRCVLRPNALSTPYQLNISYKAGERPVITIVGDWLSRGVAEFLPHVYSQEFQKLCLDFPEEKKWNPATNIADSIVPWAAEWLFHYEIWVNTGQWNGGGTTH